MRGKKGAILKCFYCKGDMKNETTAYTAELRDNRIVVIKNVPCMKCEQCGETVINGTVALELEKILKKKKCRDIMTEVAVISYSDSAA